MNKKLLLTLLVCSVSALHTASHRDFTKFKDALSAYRSNKSQQNLDALLDVYETLTLDTKRPEWATMAHNEATHFGIDIDKLAAAEPMPIPAAPIKPVAPVAPVRQPARVIAPPPAPAPVAPRRPSANPTVAPVLAAPLVSVQRPVVTRPTTVSAQKPPVQQPVAPQQPSVVQPTPTLTNEEFEAEMLKKYGAQVPAQEKKSVQFVEQPEVSILEEEEEEEPGQVQVMECGPQATAQEEEPEEEVQEPAQTSASTTISSAEELMTPYTHNLPQKLSRVRALVKKAQGSKLKDVELTLNLKEIDAAFNEIRPQLNTHDFENLQQDIGDLHVALQQRKLHTALENLDELYRYIQAETAQGRAVNTKNFENYITAYTTAQQAWIGPKDTKDAARLQKLEKEYGELFAKITSGQPLVAPVKQIDLARLKPAVVEQPAQKSSWFSWGKPVSPADAELTKLATQVHDIRQNIVALKDKPELPTELREQVKHLNALKSKFPADEKRMVQIALDLRYMNDYLAHGDKALADKAEAERKELDKNLKKLADLDKKLDTKSPKASEQKQFVELYDTIKQALLAGTMPSSNAEQWQGLMNDKFFATYHISTGQSVPMVAPGWFGQ